MLQEAIRSFYHRILLLNLKDRSVISKHIKKILDDYECDEKSNVQKMHIPNLDKLVEFYSLDVIIAVGFKTNSKRAIVFRRWANKILKEYLLTGYVINKERSLVTNENYIRLINKVGDKYKMYI